MHAKLNILGDPVPIDSMHYIHTPGLLFVLIYEAFWLVICFQFLIDQYQPCAVISILTPNSVVSYFLFLPNKH